MLTLLPVPGCDSREVSLPFLLQEMPSVSVLDYALPQRPPQARDEERDPSERALPRRSSSPVIGSPPVRAVPIGTPPKQAAIPNFNQQVPPGFPASHCSPGCKLLPRGSDCAACLFPDPVSQACPHPSYHAAALPRSLWREDVPQPALQCSGIQLSLFSVFLGIDEELSQNLRVFLWLIPTPWSLAFLGFIPYASRGL